MHRAERHGPPEVPEHPEQIALSDGSAIPPRDLGVIDIAEGSGNEEGSGKLAPIADLANRRSHEPKYHLRKRSKPSQRMT